MTFREKINSRKLAVATACILIATGLLIAEIIGPDNWVTVVITIGGAYMACQSYIDKETK